MLPELRRPSHLLAGAMAMLFGAAAVAATLLAESVPWESYHAILLASVAAAVLCTYLTAHAAREQTLLFYFTVVYAVFHFGLVPLALFPDALAEAQAGFGLEWYGDTPQVRDAHAVSVLFLAGLVVAAFIARRPTPAHGSPPSTAVSLAGPVDQRRVYATAVAVQVVCAAVWFMLTIVNGRGNYEVFLQGVESTGTGALIGIATGGIDAAFMIALLAGAWQLPLAIFLGWGSLAFTLGLRGSVAFPLVVGIGLLVSRDRVRVPAWALVFAALLFFPVSAMVGAARVPGIEPVPFGRAAFARGVGELGGSLRPVFETVGWVESDGLQLGRTYYAPFERTLLRIVPVVPRVDAEGDERLTSSLILRRSGPFGFSIAAEAFYNFAWPGALVAGLLTGLAVTACGARFVRGDISVAALGLTVGLFTHIRQSFVTGYGSALSTMLFAAIIVVIAAGGVWRRAAGTEAPAA